VNARMRQLLRSMSIGLLLLWAVSLTLPVAIFGEGGKSVFRGWDILVAGWSAASDCQFGWFANLPALAILGQILIGDPTGHRRIALVVLAVATSAFAADALLWHEAMGNPDSSEIARFGLGYYLWFAAMLGSAALGTMAALRPTTASNFS